MPASCSQSAVSGVAEGMLWVNESVDGSFLNMAPVGGAAHADDKVP